VARESSDTGPGELIENGRKVAAGRGAAWIGEGFDLFKQSPGVWIGLIVIFGLLTIAMLIIPILGNLALNLLMPVFIAGMLLGCKAQEDGDPLEIAHLFAGFKENVGQLVLVGLLELLALVVISVGIGVVVFIVGLGAAVGMRGGSAPGVGMMLGFTLLFLIAMALMLPVVMAAWFAPALIVFHELDPVAALKQSFAGCLKNFVPFLLYGVIAMLISIVAIIPFGLGLLVVWPVMMCSMYKSYRDIFCVGAGPD
jgi:hypothetical protein